MKKQKTILVADDDEMVRRLLLEVLEFYGFEVHAVSDGISALNLVENARFDIIITDYSMPRMNGIELAKILRSQYPHSFIIGMSADCEEKHFFRAGADAFLWKPFSLEGLLNIIEKK